MNTELTAIFVVVLIGFGGIGLTVAMPEDIEYMKTPDERAAEFTADIAEVKEDLYRAYVAGQISKYAMVTYTDALSFKLDAQIAKYTRMYNLLNEQIWSTDDGLVDVGNSSIWTGRTGISRGFDETVVVAPYMQRQVDNKVAELEEDKCNKDIKVEIVVTRTFYTYPGGPIFKLYHFEVTWDIYEYLYQ